MSISLAKEIRYDSITRDFACYFGGELVGFAQTMPEAQALLDEHVYDLLDRGLIGDA